MNGVLEPFIERLAQVGTLDDLTRAILRLRDGLGVDHVVYHAVNSSGAPYAALTYGPDWARRYFDAGMLRSDPVVQGAYRRFEPFDWKELDWSGKTQRRFLDEARAAGIGPQGLTVPIRGPFGQFALFTVNDSLSDDAWAAYTRANLRALILIAHYVNQTALDLEGATGFQIQKSLSPRESDTLKLLATGYSRAQAAAALRISEHTLRVYLETARNKLGAANTTHAVARALSAGLIVV